MPSERYYAWWLRRYDSVCRRVVDRYFAPGVERDDLLQEARMAVIEAIDAWDPDHGATPGQLIGTVIERRVLDAVTRARRLKHRALNDSITVIVGNDGAEVAALDLAHDRTPGPLARLLAAEELAALTAAAVGLTALERDALGGVLDGARYDTIAARNGVAVKAVDNAVQRARRKLAA